MSDQPELPGLTLPEPERHRGPVAVVRLDLPATHLDQDFDYALPEKLAERARVGQRITARFGPADRTGYIVGLTDGSDHTGELRPLRTIVSDLPVLTEEVYAAVHDVAAHYAGNISDVLRLAIPPRHARTEGQVLERSARPVPPAPSRPANVAALRGYAGGAALAESLAGGQSPTVAWQALPGVQGTQPSWLGHALELVLATLASGRRVIIVVPTARLVDRVSAALKAEQISAVAYASGKSPSARYRAFVLALLGQVDVVVGTRSAIWAPVPDLGLTLVLDEADPLLRERHAPRPQVWRIALARPGATVFASLGRSLQAQLLVERGAASSVVPSREALRSAGARVVDGDPRSGPPERLPSTAFAVVRSAVEHGPALFIVPRAGYVNVVRCEHCRQDARCPKCAGAVAMVSRAQLRCTWAGHLIPNWVCPHCGSRRWRSAAIGSERTAEDLGRAFPNLPVRISGARTGIIESVGPKPALVVATPGSEPIAQDGYACAVVLDGGVLTSRTELSATSYVLTQLAYAASLVKPASAGGRVVLTGHLDESISQALIRADHAAFAERLLAERAELHLPPVATVAELVAPRGTLTGVVKVFDGVAPGIEILGPVTLTEDSDRLIVRVPQAGAPTLRRAVLALIRRRSARGEPPINATMDPQDL